MLQLTILLEQLTNRNDLYHLSLIKGANLALNLKDDLATAFEFCRVIVDNNYSAHGGWEICQSMATKMSSRQGYTFFGQLSSNPELKITIIFLIEWLKWLWLLVLKKREWLVMVMVV